MTTKQIYAVSNLVSGSNLILGLVSRISYLVACKLSNSHFSIFPALTHPL